MWAWTVPVPNACYRNLTYLNYVVGSDDSVELQYVL